MSVENAQVRLEIIEEEARRIKEMSTRCRNRSGDLQHLDDGTVIEVIQSLKRDVEELRRRHRDICDSELLTFDYIFDHAPTARAVSLAEITESLDVMESLLWESRIASSRRSIARLKTAALQEAIILEAEVDAARRFDELKLLDPPHPTAPGSKPSETVSLERYQAILALECRALEGASSLMAAGEVSTPPAADRRLEIVQRQIELQCSCRYLETKLFENEWYDGSSSLPQRKESSDEDHVVFPFSQQDMPPPVHPEADIVRFDASPSRRVLEFARQKHEVELPATVSSAASETLRAACTKEIGSRNAAEGFSGYVKDTIKRMSLLGMLAPSLTFEVVPSHEFSLGQADPTARCTLLSVANSVDHEARLDRRTMHWLITESSQKTGGLTYVDGPMHFFFSSLPRKSHLHAFYVAHHPLTVREFNQLCADRRFADKIEHLVPAIMRREEYKMQFTTTYLNKKLFGFTEEERRRTDDDDDALEVPYFTAKAICEALGGIVCPFDVWEAGGVGLEQRAHLYQSGDAKALHPYRVGWRVAVDDGTRDVFGTSWRLSADGWRVANAQRTPFRLAKYARRGCEWNSVYDVRKKPNTTTNWIPKRALPLLSILLEGGESLPHELENSATQQPTIGVRAEDLPAYRWCPQVPCLPMSHVLRSLSDYGTQAIVAGDTMLESCDHRHFVPDEARRTFNEDAFVGCSLNTFAMPNRGIGVAAFRLAIPVFSEGFEELLRAKDAVDRQCGAHLTMLDIVNDFGKELSHMGCMRGVAPGDRQRDPLSNVDRLLFPASGFELAFSDSIPHVFNRVVFSGAHPQQRLRIVEASTFRHPIATDHSPVLALPLSKDLDEYKMFLRSCPSSGGALKIEVDDSLELTFRDTITLPMDPERHVLLGPVVHRVRVSWRFASVLGDNGETMEVLNQVIVEQLEGPS
jgi:hypothetical protein